MGDGEQLTIALVGDSLAAGVGASSELTTLESTIRSSVPVRISPIRIINLSKSGAGLSDVISDQLPQLSTIRPTKTVVIVGANDIFNKTHANHFRDELRKLGQFLEGCSKQTLILDIPRLTLTPIFPKQYRFFFDHRIKKFNRIITHEMAAFPTFSVFDFYRLTSNLLRYPIQWVSSDMYHPNDKAYALLADKIVGKLFSDGGL